MIKVRFGLALDGARTYEPGHRLGEPVLGPMGLIGLLETHLGLLSVRATTIARIIQYRACLKELNRPVRFFHHSFEADPLGTAAALLKWRDLWHLHGWDGRAFRSQHPRLADMQAVEELALRRVAPSIGQRLAAIAAALARRRTGVAEVHVLESMDSLPMRWREVLAMLGTREAPLQWPDNAPGVLGDLQRALRVLGPNITPGGRWRDDGSLSVVRAETRLLGGRWLGESMAAERGTTLLVATSDGALLDDVMVAAGRPRQGFSDASEARPPLQVLPLALATMWDPLDVTTLIEFLSHPIGPLPRRARSRLAKEVSQRPGLGGERFQKEVEDIVTSSGDDGARVRAAIETWVRHVRFSESDGAPLGAVMERVSGLVSYFQGRMAEEDAAVRSLIASAYVQCSSCLDCLQQFAAQGETHIRRRQLEQLVAQATAMGSDDPSIAPEVGCGLATLDPAAVIEPADHVYWWQMAMPRLPSPHPWSRAELADLAAAGITVPSTRSLLDQLALQWRRPLLAARHRLTLVLPPAGQEVHPAWQLVSTLVTGIPVQALESLLDRPDPSLKIKKIATKRLPRRRAYWKLEPESIACIPEHASFSSLDLYFHDPHRWVLGYAAGLRDAGILSAPDDFTLSGTLSHRLVERFFRLPDALTMREPKVKSWFGQTLPAVIAAEGATLLMPGRAVELERFRTQLLDSLIALRSHLVAAGIVAATPEVKLDGKLDATGLTGYADLVVVNKLGEHAIVDLKWGGRKKYPDKLRSNTHLQLVIYSELLRQTRECMPRCAYFILESAQLFAHDRAFFPDAIVIGTDDPRAHPELWQRVLASWKWRREQLEAGRVTVAPLETSADEPPQSPAGCWPFEFLNQQYNPLRSLAGWD